MDRYLTVEETAKVLGMSARYVCRLVAERRIPFHRHGRSFRLAETDVVAFALASRVEPMTVEIVPRVVGRVA